MRFGMGAENGPEIPGGLSSRWALIQTFDTIEICSEEGVASDFHSDALTSLRRGVW